MRRLKSNNAENSQHRGNYHCMDETTESKLDKQEANSPMNMSRGCNVLCDLLYIILYFGPLVNKDTLVSLKAVKT